MRLQLSVAAQDLSSSATTTRRKNDHVAPMVVVMLRRGAASPENAKLELLGQTEALYHSNGMDADWTKLFTIHDWHLGQSCHIMVNVYDQNDPQPRSGEKETTTPWGTVLFDVASVLGAPGQSMAQPLFPNTNSDGDEAMVVIHLEEVSEEDSMLQFQFRGWQLANLDGGLGLLNKSDPFFEIQRWHVHSRVWDTVYRSAVINNDLNPSWDEGYVSIQALVGGSGSSRQQRSTPFRLAVYDADAHGKRSVIGYAVLTLSQLSRVVYPAAVAKTDKRLSNDEIDKAIVLKLGDKIRGYVFVVTAHLVLTGGDDAEKNESGGVAVIRSLVTSVQQEEEIEISVEPEILVDPEADLTLESTTTANATIDLHEEDIPVVPPNFTSYLKSGCELRVFVAIDMTASNGDPRQASSLHFLGNKDSRNENLNAYETALLEVCTALAPFDSDQRYPCYGFGAKRNNVVDHCFSLLNDDAETADGVQGILDAYRQALQGGLVMSAPRDFTHVVAQVRTLAQQQVTKDQFNYSILLIVTNGVPADMDKTKAALQACGNAPLSIVSVGVGDADFTELQTLANDSRFSFVPYSRKDAAPVNFAQAALGNIPTHLVDHFTKHNILPSHPIEATNEGEIDVVVTPNYFVQQQEDHDEDIAVLPHIYINDAGQASLHQSESTTHASSSTSTPHTQQQQSINYTQLLRQGRRHLREGRRLLRQHKRRVGQVKRLARKYLNF